MAGNCFSAAAPTNESSIDVPMIERPDSDTSTSIRARVETASAALRAGRGVIVRDAADRENEGDFVFAASMATPELVAFAMVQCRGLLCAPMNGDALDRLSLWQMAPESGDPLRTAFTVSVDARIGTTTGISAADRARTLRLLAAADTVEADLSRPGHVFPLRAKSGGVLHRAGHTEAAVDILRLAELPPVGAICEIANADGSMARQADLERFAVEFDLPMMSIADLVAYRRYSERQVEYVCSTRLPLPQGTFRAAGYRSTLEGLDHVALVLGDIGDGRDVLVRLHSECFVGDVFGSLRCECRSKLKAALRAVAREGRGIVLYVRNSRGSEQNLLSETTLLDHLDGGEGVTGVGITGATDTRDYGVEAQILADLGVYTMRLLTNRVNERIGLEGFGLYVSARIALPTSELVDHTG
jgi:3,4-dihydroxy 2-butanone 4-phosphate synthase/GTP cyclohydrolase II